MLQMGKLRPERLGKLSEVFQLGREGAQVARGSRYPHLDVPAERSWQSSIQLGSHNPEESSSGTPSRLRECAHAHVCLWPRFTLHMQRALSFLMTWFS